MYIYIVKILYAILLLSLFQVSTSAQKIYFTDTTNEWYVKQKTHAPSSQWQNFIFNYKKGSVIINGKTYWDVGLAHIREDTLNEKIYVVHKAISVNIDTSEQVLYDYNLKIGDTIRKTYRIGDTSKHYVLSIDSILIQGVYHKIWDIQGAPGGNSSGYSYKVIEGIGSTSGPLYPLNPTGFEHYYDLYCFHNDGNIITVPNNATIWLPRNGDFLSPGTCLTSVNDFAANNNTIYISPHPANSNSIIKLPFTIYEGELAIYNSVGQLIWRDGFTGVTEMSLANMINIPGTYIYRITDKSGQVYRGRFIYQ